MLVPLQEKDFDQYIDFAYELALDPTRAGYPAYFDGIKTKEDFTGRANRSCSIRRTARRRAGSTITI